jgi:hypothetical protein
LTIIVQVVSKKPQRKEFPTVPFLFVKDNTPWMAMKPVGGKQFGCVELGTGFYNTIALPLDWVLPVGEEVVIKQTS